MGSRYRDPQSSVLHDSPVETVFYVLVGELSTFLRVQLCAPLNLRSRYIFIHWVRASGCRQSHLCVNWPSELFHCLPGYDHTGRPEGLGREARCLTSWQLPESLVTQKVTSTTSLTSRSDQSLRIKNWVGNAWMRLGGARRGKWNAQQKKADAHAGAPGHCTSFDA